MLASLNRPNSAFCRWYRCRLKVAALSRMMLVSVLLITPTKSHAAKCWWDSLDVFFSKSRISEKFISQTIENARNRAQVERSSNGRLITLDPANFISAEIQIDHILPFLSSVERAKNYPSSDVVLQLKGLTARIVSSNSDNLYIGKRIYAYSMIADCNAFDSFASKLGGRYFISGYLEGNGNIILLPAKLLIFFNSD